MGSKFGKLLIDSALSGMYNELVNQPLVNYLLHLKHFLLPFPNWSL